MLALRSGSGQGRRVAPVGPPGPVRLRDRLLQRRRPPGPGLPATSTARHRRRRAGRPSNPRPGLLMAARCADPQQRSSASDKRKGARRRAERDHAHADRSAAASRNRHRAAVWDSARSVAPARAVRVPRGRVDRRRRRLVAERDLHQRDAPRRPAPAAGRRPGPLRADDIQFCHARNVSVEMTLVPGELSATPRFSQQQQQILRELCQPLLGDGDGAVAAGRRRDRREPRHRPEDGHDRARAPRPLVRAERDAVLRAPRGDRDARAALGPRQSRRVSAA